MAFKTVLPSTQAPESPEELFRELPRRRIPDVLPHQRKLLREYVARAVESSDVALQLPTGSGKTLVGLLIAEWRRRKNQERTVFLCPTRHLVNQVVEQAEEKYGLTVLGFTGSARNYDATARAEYLIAGRAAVTTYSSLFNTNPFFSNADIVIVDDSHVADNYISELWSIRIERLNSAHTALHAALQGVLRPLIDPLSRSRLAGQSETADDGVWVDKIPTPEFMEIANEVAEVLELHTPHTNLTYPWSMVRDHLLACHVYLSSQEILIRPLIPPTWTHAAFHEPKQRIYMSATLGAGGDLERIMGRRKIQRLSTPDQSDHQGVGRRFFIFPGTSPEADKAVILRRDLMRIAKRSLVLVPSGRMRDEIARDVTDNLRFPVLGADDIEDSKKCFTSASRAVVALANRYDGTDFPGEECRLLFIEGLPKATNLQEQFLTNRMAANVLLNERIQNRVLQSIGRCTRSLEDYSAVVVSGEQLTDYLINIRRRKYLRPELQAEIAFGVEQSKGQSIADLAENFKIFLENGEEWEKVNQQIITASKNAVQKPFPAMEELNDTVANEIKFQEHLWQGDYEAAFGCAEKILRRINRPNLRGYRTLWHYLAGSVASLGANAGSKDLNAKARIQFSKAKKASPGIPWLVKLARSQFEATVSVQDNTILMEQIERVEAKLTQLGAFTEGRFAKYEKRILDGLHSTKKGPFEESQMLLGKLLGYEAGNKETDGAPDPWWIASTVCFVFEDHAGAGAESALSVKKARQVSSHPAWMRHNIEATKNADILPVLVTPVRTVKRGAVAHLNGVSLWTVDQYREWSANAIAVIRHLRRTFSEPGNLIWRAKAAEKFEEHCVDAPGLCAMLRSKPAVDNLESVR